LTPSRTWPATTYGVKTEGNAVGGNAAVLDQLARLVAAGTLEVPIFRTYPLEQVREAYGELARGHLLGKIVLIP
jgi:NADPH:quinone reductase-like Zn-dependent oxidoreductase